MNDVTVGEVHRRERETREMLQAHIDECGKRWEKSDKILQTINDTMIASQAVREERMSEHDRKGKRTNVLITLVGTAIALLSAAPVVLLLFGKGG